VVVQSDLFNAAHASITVCPITSDCVDAPLFRITLPPGARTGLSTASQVMVDKVVSGPRAAVVRAIGGCDPDQLSAIDDALRVWLEL
jgi:mRNA interferase MazF